MTMSWCFAIVNGKLAEIFFDEMTEKARTKKQMRIFGHCYVKKEEYETKKEQQWIAKDTKEMRLVYRNNVYKLHKNAGRRAQQLTVISSGKKLPFGT